MDNEMPGENDLDIALYEPRQHAVFPTTYCTRRATATPRNMLLRTPKDLWEAPLCAIFQ